MAKDGFGRAYARVRVYEGGNVDDPRDPGGRTSRGVTQRVYTAWLRRQGLPSADVWTATDAQVEAIYRALYWTKAGCDELPAGVDFVVFDGAINSGVGQSVRWLQRSLSGYSGAVDGAIGDVTLHAAAQDEDNDALVARYCAARLGTLRGLKTWRTYGRGWAARIANAQKIGQAWASGSVGPAPVAVDQVGGHRKAVVSADTISRPLLSTASTTLVTSASAVAAPASELGQQLEVMREWFAWMPYVLGALAVVAGIAGIIVKYGHTVADAVQAGTTTRAVDVQADQDLPAVAVNDNAPEALATPAPAAEAA